MKARVLLVMISVALLPAPRVFGQFTCDGSTKLVCQFPVSAETLSSNTFGTGARPSALATSAPINAAVAAQLTQLPVPSSTIGVIQVKRKGTDVAAPFPNLGPILTDRPDTVGKGHVFMGVNYQHFNFNALDGFNLSALPIAFTYSDGTHNFFGSMQNTVSFQLDQYVYIATAGITQSTDLSVIVPVNSVNLSVTSSQFKAYEYDIASGKYFNLTPNAPGVTTRGTATGLGDVIVGLKQMLLGQEHNRPAAAIGATFRFPTGNSENYLGSGAVGGSLYGLLEYRARFAPHFKLSYVWNDTSKVLNLVKTSSSRLPGGLQYAVGTDFRANKKITLSVDILGSQFVNTPNLTEATLAFNPVPASGLGIPATYNLVSTPNNTYTPINFSGGVKFSPATNFLIYGNAVIQLNNVGLRSDVVPLVGIAYNFSKKAD